VTGQELQGLIAIPDRSKKCLCTPQLPVGRKVRLASDPMETERYIIGKRKPEQEAEHYALFSAELMYGRTLSVLNCWTLWRCS
jgi:hypothetical protein